MSLKAKRICKCCGKEYEYCPHCGSKGNDLWKNLTDTKECLAVFNIVAAYNIGRATAEQVKKVLKENNINDYSSFAPSIVSALNEVYKASEKPAVEASVKEQPIIVEDAVDITLVDEVPKTEEEIENPKVKIETVITGLVEENAPHVVEVKSAPRKIRGGKKKRRQRNTDIEL